MPVMACAASSSRPTGFSMTTRVGYPMADRRDPGGCRTSSGPMADRAELPLCSVSNEKSAHLVLHMHATQQDTKRRNDTLHNHHHPRPSLPVAHRLPRKGGT